MITTYVNKIKNKDKELEDLINFNANTLCLEVVKICQLEYATVTKENIEKEEEDNIVLEDEPHVSGVGFDNFLDSIPAIKCKVETNHVTDDASSSYLSFADTNAFNVNYPNTYFLSAASRPKFYLLIFLLRPYKMYPMFVFRSKAFPNSNIYYLAYHIYTENNE